MKLIRRVSLFTLALLLALAPLTHAEGFGPVSLSEDEHRAVNLFLSNFSEIGLDEISTDSEDKDLVDFAHDHLWFNDYESYEYGEYDNDTNCRVSDNRVQEIINAYFHDPRAVDLTQTRFEYDGDYYYHTETGGWSNSGFAVNTSVCPIQDGLYYVSFMIFGAGEFWENDVMSLSLSAAWERFGHPCGYGSALISAGDLSDRSTFKLVSYGTI